MEQQIIQGLLSRGIPLPIAQGIVANMIAESGLNPGINEAAPLVAGSRGGYGLNQWTGPRRRQYEAFAAERGVSPDDLNAQLDFTVYELQGPEKSAWEALQGAGDAETAARIYSERFLRPGIPHMDKRLSEARRVAGLPMSPMGDRYAPQNALAGMPQQPTQNALSQGELMRMAQAMTPQINQLDPQAFMSKRRF